MASRVNEELNFLLYFIEIHFNLNSPMQLVVKSTTLDQSFSNLEVLVS